METKTCTKCRRTLPLTAFHRAKNRPQGTRASCKECRNRRWRADGSLEPLEDARAAIAATRVKYRATQLGKAAAKRHRSSPAGLAATRRYAASELGKETRARLRRQYLKDGRYAAWQLDYQERSGRREYKQSVVRRAKTLLDAPTSIEAEVQEPPPDPAAEKWALFKLLERARAIRKANNRG